MPPLAALLPTLQGLATATSWGGIFAMPDNAANKRHVLVDLVDVTDTPDSEDFADSRPHRWAT